MSNFKMLSTRVDVKKTLTLAWPVILGQLSHIFLGVVDTIMVGELGVTQLAAAALANSYFVLPLTFAFGLASAIAPLTAEAAEKHNLKRLHKIFQNGSLILLLVGIFFALILMSGKFILPYLNQPANVVTESLAYIDYLALSIIPIAVYLHLKNFLEGFEWMYPALWIGIVSIPLNALLNYIFMYGKLGLPVYGLEGAGIATLITRTTMLLALIIVLIKSKYGIYLKAKFLTNRKTISKICSIGIPAGSQYVFEAGAFVFAALLMGMLGEKQLAAHQIAINIASIPFMISIGIASAGAIRMGNLLGANNWSQIKLTGKNIQFVSLLLMIATTAILYFGRHIFASAYNDNLEVLSMAAHMLIIAAIFQISDGIQAVMIGILRGLQDVIWPTVISLFSYWIVAIPIGIYLGFYTDLNYFGIWIGLFIGLSVSSILTIYRFNSITRRNIV